jgi:NAD(P)-dependent dehydrogenase (short-subunit alcohol dehydrogenase family)
MNIADQVVVVTGAASGIGRALAQRFHDRGAKHVVVVDRNGEGAEIVARGINGTAFVCDVSKEADLRRVVEQTERQHAPIGLFCSNAGIVDFDPDPVNAAAAPDEVWNRAWGVHVMSHVYAARILLPRYRARGGGYFLNTISAAGLLTQLGSSVYSTTKHAAVGFAESLAIAHRDDGIKVSILCPQGVDTPMLNSGDIGPQHLDGVLTPAQVADAVMAGLEKEQFLILPHPDVAKYMQAKAADYDRWIGGMCNLRKKVANLRAARQGADR